MEKDSNQGVRAFALDHCDDYFIELCALSTTNVLSLAEWKQLELHLSFCARCREVKAQQMAAASYLFLTNRLDDLFAASFFV